MYIASQAGDEGLSPDVLTWEFSKLLLHHLKNLKFPALLSGEGRELSGMLRRNKVQSDT